MEKSSVEKILERGDDQRFSVKSRVGMNDMVMPNGFAPK